MKYTPLALTLALVSACCALAATRNASAADAPRIKCVAHRGAADLIMPEGSLAAYSNAVAGASEIVKLDVRATRDGIPVMSHDPTLKRTMGWDAQIADLPYATLKGKGTFLGTEDFKGYRIVTLGEALDIVQTVPEFWIDFKFFSSAFAARVMDEFAAHGIADSRIMCATFNAAAFPWLKAHHPTVRLVAHTSVTRAPNGKWTLSCGSRKGKFATKRELLDAILAYRDEIGLYGVNMPILKGQTLPEDVTYLKKHDLWVSLWFVQNPITAALYRECAPDAFVTDHASDVR